MNDGVNILTLIVNSVESELPQILLHGSCAKIRIEDSQYAPVSPEQRRHKVKEYCTVLMCPQAGLAVVTSVCLKRIVETQ